MRKKIRILLAVLVFCMFASFIPTTEAAGQQLIIINKKNNQLAYYENGRITKLFLVGTGRQASMTPEGKFNIVNKIKNRPYYAGNIPGGSAKNPLGNRWLGINARGTWGTTYAIHGNNNPASIGNYVSAGCVRMYNEQIQWLFDHVAVNTPVIITNSTKGFNAIATANGYKASGNVNVALPFMKKGDRNEAVRIVQKRLLQLGFNPNGVDGTFGAGTERAVKQFQISKKLSPNGMVGATTAQAMGL
ncbi:L,D-transpeptidase family protein [Bacillus massiliigorillae]|uniref:L,D-transpeptidase family protein n=1 Tax=Bacillus massiliigorillae TaxID=1243664 RepID=UPI0003A20ACB|nr:L,D-transpeptidase family protein [Bacillus massiliigorillae]